MQLRATYGNRRLVLVTENFSILDFFDKNAFDIDPRQGFLSLGFLTYGLGFRLGRPWLLVWQVSRNSIGTIGR